VGCAPSLIHLDVCRNRQPSSSPLQLAPFVLGALYMKTLWLAPFEFDALYMKRLRQSVVMSIATIATSSSAALVSFDTFDVFVRKC
jgi:hypothetical protein